VSVFMKNPSPSYQAAVRALQELAKSEGPDAAENAAAEALQPVRQRLFVERSNLTTATGSVCAKRLTGKRCTVANPRGCDCHPRGSSGHSSLWNCNGKPAVYVAQPYELTLREMKDLVSYCEKHDLDASINARSSWDFPGHTLQVEIIPRSK